MFDDSESVTGFVTPDKLGIPMEITGIASLRHEESDDITVVVTFINAIGVSHCLAVKLEDWEYVLSSLNIQLARAIDVINNLDKRVESELQEILEKGA